MFERGTGAVFTGAEREVKGRSRIWRGMLALAVIGSVSIGLVAMAETPSDDMTPAARESWRISVTDRDIARFASVPPNSLKLRLVPLPVEELETRAETALVGLRTVADRLADALVRQGESEMTGAPKRGAADLAQRVRRLRDYRADLVTRCNIVLGAWEAKGGDVTKHRAYVAMVEQLEPAAQLEPPANEEERTQRELTKQVAAIVALVREMPPVHERPEPWTVPLNELELELQPLQRQQIEERAQKWLDILQRNMRLRIRTDIAIAEAESPALRQALADESAKQQEVVNAIVQRVKVTLHALSMRGGQVGEYQDYVSAATGQRLNVANPAVLVAQLKAWLRSPIGGVRVGTNLMKFIAVLLTFWIVARFVSALVAAAVGRVRGSSTLLNTFMTRMSRRVVLAIGFVVGLSVLEINISPLVAALAGAGLVIGLALQGTLSNFASGVLILLNRPYDVGDVVHAGGVSGKVDAMSLVSTRILTFDNQMMLVPNNQIWNGVITNVTAMDTRRIDMTFGIGYSDDIAKAKTVIEELLADHDGVLDDPAPTVKVHELGDSSVNIIARPWVQTADYWKIYWDLTQQVKERFDQEGISIPFPQRDVHVYSQDVAVGEKA